MATPQEWTATEVVDKDEKPEEAGLERNLNVYLICPDCKTNPPNIVEDFCSGDLVCFDCGVVLMERIVDTRAEWRTFDNDNDRNYPSRINQAVDIESEQLNLKIAKSEKAVNKGLIPAPKRLSAYCEHKLQEGCSRIKDMCAIARLSDGVAEYAQGLWILTQKKRFRLGSHTLVQAACVFIACRKTQSPCTYKEISKLYGLELPQLGKAFKKLENFLKKNIEADTVLVGGAVTLQNQYVKASAPPASQYINHFGKKLGLPYSVISKAKECADALVLHGGLEKRTPGCIAGVAIYIMSHIMGHSRSMKEIGAVVCLQASTIHTGYRLVCHHHEKWMKSEWLEDGGNINLLPKLNTIK